MNKKLKLTALIMLALICLFSGNVLANYQSSPSSTKKASYNMGTFLSGIKSMKGSGEVINTSSSALDVHMQKNTEYGAMLILAVSDYGKQGNGTKDGDWITKDTYGLATTTGNVSGIYQIGSAEYVAAGASDINYAKELYYEGTRYKNKYTTVSYENRTKEKGDTLKGDAMDIPTWQGSTQRTWLYKESTDYSYPTYYYYFKRANFGYISAKSGASGYTADIDSRFNVSETGYTRACIVNGEGF